MYYIDVRQKLTLSHLAHHLVVSTCVYLIKLTIVKKKHDLLAEIGIEQYICITGGRSCGRGGD